MAKRLRVGFLSVLFAAAVAGQPVVLGQQAQYDVLIRNGHVVDGTGNPWFAADVGIRGDRIVAVGRLAGAKGMREIDARGLIVAPGFIDLHTHSDLSLLNDGNAESKLRHGVTVDVIGESTSVAPRDGLPDAKGTWTDFSGYWQALRQKGISMNVISEVSFQQLRLVAVGYNPGPATQAQLERMKTLAARSMEEGAWGLVARFESGGPEQPEEVIEVAKVVAKYDGIYVTHVGSEGAEQDRELDFAIRVAQDTKMPVHIFHLKIRGEENWGTIGKYLAKIEAARARGLDVTANQYPYTAMQHGWSAFFPVWARQHGPQKFAAMLNEDGVPHPRSFSTNPRVLGHYVRDQRVLTLEDAVRKMTSLPAQILGLRDRGQVREGFAADVVIFNPATVRETTTFEKTTSYPEGMPYTIVNGVVVIDNGTHTGARPGKPLFGRGFRK